MLCGERYTPLTEPSTSSWCTCEHGSAWLQGTGQLYLDFLQCTSPRHQDDLARTSHIQRLQTKLNKAPVWVCKAQNTAEPRGFCCISLYECMCCTSLWGPELQYRADIHRTKLQKAHIRNCTVYHIPTSCVWREMDTCVCCLAGREATVVPKERGYGQHTVLSPSSAPAVWPPPCWRLRSWLWIGLSTALKVKQPVPAWWSMSMYSNCNATPPPRPLYSLGPLKNPSFLFSGRGLISCLENYPLEPVALGWQWKDTNSIECVGESHRRLFKGYSRILIVYTCSSTYKLNASWSPTHSLAWLSWPVCLYNGSQTGE